MQGHGVVLRCLLWHIQVTKRAVVLHWYLLIMRGKQCVRIAAI